MVKTAVLEVYIDLRRYGESNPQLLSVDQLARSCLDRVTTWSALRCVLMHLFCK